MEKDRGHGVIQADEEARLTHMSAGEGAEQRSETARKVEPRCHLRIGVLRHDYDEVNIREHIHATMHQRAAGEHGVEARIGREPEGLVEEGDVADGKRADFRHDGPG